MDKDFDRWNDEKKRIHARPEEVRFHEREIWCCALGVNVGSEQDGTNENFERPVVVVKNFSGRVLWVVPLTRTHKRSPFYFPIERDSVVILSQLRLISSKRLIRKIGMLDKPQFKILLHLISDFLRNALLSES
jgi:mRNA interferase MazF